MRKVLDSLVWLSIGAACVAGLYWARPVIVGGGSMTPTLYAGDMCLAVRAVEPRAGDMVLYRDGDRRLVVHRVVTLGQRGELRTKGDANTYPDGSSVAKDDVLGRVVLVVPFGRAFRGWMGAVTGATLLNQSHTRR